MAIRAAVDVEVQERHAPQTRPLTLPTRQFVLSLPVWLRYLLAWRHELCLEVLGIFADALGNFYKEQARGQGIIS